MVAPYPLPNLPLFCDDRLPESFWLILLLVGLSEFEATDLRVDFN